MLAWLVWSSLQVGCGAGNTIFPLLSTFPDIFVHACDFSPRAVDLVKVFVYLIYNKSWSAEQLGHVLSAVLPIWCCVTICWMVSAEAQGLQTWPVKCICLWYYIRTTNWEHGTFFCWYCNNGNMLCSDNVSILNNLFDISVTLFALFHYSQLGVQTTNILSRYLCSLQLHQIKCL